jgi:drug/metabolite transporter (DMT)-like permease
MSRISPSATAGSAVAAGIGMMLLGMLLFSMNDVMGKWLVATYTVGQLLLIRSVAALGLLAPFIRREGGVAAITGIQRPWLQLVRAFFATAEVALFYWAVIYLPLADVITFYLAGPIYVTALSVILLGERVGWRRWAAVLVGFLGVVIALRPSAASFTVPALIALAGSLFFAVSMITTRMLRGTSDTMLVATQTLGALLLGAVAAPFGWVTPNLRDFLLLCLLGIVALVAHACTNRSLKLAPASVVVPYQYTLIVWAIVFGYLVFGDVPAALMLAGAVIIIAAGLFIFLREQAAVEQALPPEAHP